jgi:hypothetical protein
MAKKQLASSARVSDAGTTADGRLTNIDFYLVKINEHASLSRAEHGDLHTFDPTQDVGALNGCAPYRAKREKSNA